MPTWSKPEVFMAAKAQMTKTAELVGLTAKELNEFVDHRHIHLLWKASEYDRYQALRKTKLPGLRKLPKVSIRAGARRSMTADRGERRKKVLSAHQSIGTQDSAAKAIEALFGDELG